MSRLPKKNLGNNPQRNTPSHRAKNAGNRGAHQSPNIEAIHVATPIMTVKNPIPSHNVRGRSRGPVGTSRYALRSRSSCCSLMVGKMRSLTVDGKRKAA